MCAINPTHKKRFILDVYTSHPDISEEEFYMYVMGLVLENEQHLNSAPYPFRWHIKESKEEAE